MSDKKPSFTMQQNETVSVPQDVLDRVLFGDKNSGDNPLQNIADDLKKTFSKLETKEVKLTKK